MGDKQLKLKFWGTRGSNPSAAQNMSTYGGETTCVELSTAKNELVIFDMGTGIIRLGNALLQEKNPVKDIHILLSHFHWDHIIGFASFKPVLSMDEIFKKRCYNYENNSVQLDKFML